MKPIILCILILSATLLQSCFRDGPDPRFNNRIWQYGDPHVGTAIEVSSLEEIVVAGTYDVGGPDSIPGPGLFWRVFDSNGRRQTGMRKPTPGVLHKVNGIAVDQEDMFYIAGKLLGDATSDNEKYFAEHSTNGSEDMFVAKYDLSHRLEWALVWQSSGNDCAFSVLVDDTGQVLITGYFNGTMDFDPGAEEFICESQGSEDVFLMSLNTDGTFNWVRTWGGSRVDAGLSVTVDSLGFMYLAGYFNDTVSFDGEVNSYTLTANGADDAFLVKFDPNASPIWARAWSGPGATFCTDIDTVESGYIVATGYFSDTVDFDTGSGSITCISSGNDDVFLCKLNTSDGAVQWAKSFGGVGSERSFAIALGDDGSMYSTGAFTYTVDFDPGPDIHEHASTGGSDAFLIKLDTQGEFQFARTWGDMNFDDTGYDLVLVNSSLIHVTGQLYCYAFIRSFNSNGSLIR